MLSIPPRLRVQLKGPRELILQLFLPGRVKAGMGTTSRDRLQLAVFAEPLSLRFEMAIADCVEWFSFMVDEI